MIKINYILTGLLMGIAEIIPGISGGTIAFISGIYDKLLQSINGISQFILKDLKSKGIKGIKDALPWNFIFNLILGMGTGLVIGILIIKKMLEDYPPIIMAIFFGLVIGSIWLVQKLINLSKILNIVLILSFAILTFLITSSTPISTNPSLIFIFFGGMIAISAMILPGISGSFLLLLMGLYPVILDAAHKLLTTFDTQSLSIISIFGLGAIIGIFSFSRVVSFALENYKEKTISALLGVMIGSLYKIWPWQNKITIQGTEKTLTNSVLPFDYEDDIMMTGSLVSFVFGLGLVACLMWLEQKNKASNV